MQVRARHDGTKAVFAVSDTGMGMSAEDKERLFTRFFRSPTAMSMAIPGTGLGLAIVKKIVDDHGGTIEVESVPGAGTTVEFTIPLSPPCYPPAAAHPPSPQHRAEPPPPSPSGPRPTVSAAGSGAMSFSVPYAIRVWSQRARGRRGGSAGVDACARRAPGLPDLASHQLPARRQPRPVVAGGSPHGGPRPAAVQPDRLHLRAARFPGPARGFYGSTMALEPVLRVRRRRRPSAPPSSASSAGRSDCRRPWRHVLLVAVAPQPRGDRRRRRGRLRRRLRAPPGRPSLRTQRVLVAAGGVVAGTHLLIKFNTGVTLFVVGAVTALSWSGGRGSRGDLPRRGPGVAGRGVARHRNGLGDLLAFFDRSWQVASGYSEAMSVETRLPTWLFYPSPPRWRRW